MIERMENIENATVFDSSSIRPSISRKCLRSIQDRDCPQQQNQADDFGQKQRCFHSDRLNG